MECHYNAVQFITILHKALRWQGWNVNQTLPSQQIPHTLPIRVSYGVPIVSILDKTDHLITAQHCMFLHSVLPVHCTVKCHYNACHYNANASLTRSILGSQTAPTCPHNHPQVAQHMGKRCEIIAVWSATAAMTPLCSHTNGIKQRYPTCWLCQCSRFMIDLRSNTQIIHLRYSENAIIWPIWLLDARMFKTIPVAIKLR